MHAGIDWLRPSQPASRAARAGCVRGQGWLLSVCAVCSRSVRLAHPPTTVRWHASRGIGDTRVALEACRSSLPCVLLTTHSTHSQPGGQHHPQLHPHPLSCANLINAYRVASGLDSWQGRISGSPLDLFPPSRPSPRLDNAAHSRQSGPHFPHSHPPPHFVRKPLAFPTPSFILRPSSHSIPITLPTTSCRASSLRECPL